MYTLFTDGGSRGNPGKAAIGGVLYEGAEVKKDFAANIGIATNNVAEYKALIKGIETAVDLDIQKLDCFLDSELVVKQLNGLYKVKDASMKELFTEVAKLRTKFAQISFTHVEREKNSYADKLVNKALDTGLDF